MASNVTQETMAACYAQHTKDLPQEGEYYISCFAVP